MKNKSVRCMLPGQKIISEKEHNKIPAPWLLVAALFIICHVAFGQKEQTLENSLEINISRHDQVKQADTFSITQKRYLPKKGMLPTYQNLFNQLHGPEEKLVFDHAGEYRKVTYDSANNIYYGHLQNTNVLKPGSEVYGWHPYWIGESYKYYPYSLLTTIAFYAYDVNENDGSCNSPEAINIWKKTAMIDSSKNNKVQVLLSVTSYGKERNGRFLSNRDAWAMLGDSLLHLLRMRQAQGIDIDFTEIPASKKEDFGNMLYALRNKLGDTSFISVHLTSQLLASSGLNLLKIKSEARINRFIVQGFDYQNTPEQPEALAPLYSQGKKEECIASLIAACLSQGLEKSDLILSLPLYGMMWENREALEIKYADIASLYEKEHPGAIDDFSESTKIMMGKNNDSILWYESGESLYRKFLWANIHGLRGAGLWGLGYDGGREEVWNAVAKNYGIPPVREIRPVKIIQGSSYSIIQALQKYRKIIGVSLCMLVTFIIIGILLSLLDWRVREMFFRNDLYRALLGMLLLLLVLTAVFCFTGIKNNEGSVAFPLVTGIILGSAALYIISRMAFNRKNLLP